MAEQNVEQPAAKFKVGQRVRVVSNASFGFGLTGVVYYAEQNGAAVAFPDGITVIYGNADLVHEPGEVADMPDRSGAAVYARNCQEAAAVQNAAFNAVMKPGKTRGQEVAEKCVRLVMGSYGNKNIGFWTSRNTQCAEAVPVEPISQFDNIRDWLASLIDAERTDAVKEHDEKIKDRLLIDATIGRRADQNMGPFETSQWDAALRGSSPDSFRRNLARELYADNRRQFPGWTVKQAAERSVSDADELIAALAKPTAEQLKAREESNAKFTRELNEDYLGKAGPK